MNFSRLKKQTNISSSSCLLCRHTWDYIRAVLLWRSFPAASRFLQLSASLQCRGVTNLFPAQIFMWWEEALSPQSFSCFPWRRMANTVVDLPQKIYHPDISFSHPKSCVPLLHVSKNSYNPCHCPLSLSTCLPQQCISNPSALPVFSGNEGQGYLSIVELFGGSELYFEHLYTAMSFTIHLDLAHSQIFFFIGSIFVFGGLPLCVGGGQPA